MFEKDKCEVILCMIGNLSDNDDTLKMWGRSCGGKIRDLTVASSWTKAMVMRQKSSAGGKNSAPIRIKDILLLKYSLRGSRISGGKIIAIVCLQTKYCGRRIVSGHPLGGEGWSSTPVGGYKYGRFDKGRGYLAHYLDKGPPSRFLI